MRRREIEIAPVPEGVAIRLDPTLVAVLVRLPVVLDSIEPGTDDPAARRLRIPVYLDDPKADEEWWGYMGEELELSRAADRSAFVEALEASAGGTVMSVAEAHAVVRVLVESRLALAARLGIETEDDYERLGEAEGAMLGVLGEVQLALLAALGPR